MKKQILAIILLSSVSIQMQALDLEVGQLKIRVNESNGRYGLFYTESLDPVDYKPLFLAEDTRTTTDILFLDNIQLILGEQGGFNVEVASTNNSVTILYTRDDFQVRKLISFISSANAVRENGVKITYSMTNQGEETRNASLAVLVDTILGENGSHFFSSTGQSVSSEARFSGTRLPNHLISSAPDNDSFGLMLMVKGIGITTPVDTTIANWRRLNDGGYNYNFKQGRDFNLLPYSLNDSAVLYRYQSEDLRPGDSRQITFVMGSMTGGGFTGTNRETSNEIEQILNDSRLESVLTEQQIYQKDILVVDNLMDIINGKLDNPENLSADDLVLIQAILDELESRASLYGESD